MNTIDEINTKSLADAALYWVLAHNLRIVPCFWTEGGVCVCFRAEKCDRPGKHPRADHGHLEASTDLQAITQHWAEFPAANIAMPCRLNNRVVIDIDPKNGGIESIIKLEEKIGPLVSPWTFVSGSGGGHRHFVDPGGALLGTLADYPGIDFKCEGFVVMPSSVHVSGGTYRVADGSNLSQPVPPMPEALLALLRKPESNGTTAAVVGEWSGGAEPDLLRAAALTANFAPATGVRDDFYAALAGGLGAHH